MAAASLRRGPKGPPHRAGCWRAPCALRGRGARSHLQRGKHGVTHVQLAGHVGRRHGDDVRLALGRLVRLEVAAALPPARERNAPAAARWRDPCSGGLRPKQQSASCGTNDGTACMPQQGRQPAPKCWFVLGLALQRSHMMPGRVPTSSGFQPPAPVPPTHHWYSASSLAAGSKFLGNSLRWLLLPGCAASAAASVAAVLAAAASRGCRCLLPSPLQSCGPIADRRGPQAALVARHCRRAAAGSRAGWVRELCMVENLLLVDGNTLSKEERSLKEHFISPKVGTWSDAKSRRQASAAMPQQCGPMPKGPGQNGW